MKPSQAWYRVGMMLMGLGLCVAIPWVFVSFRYGDGLTHNGAWFLTVLLFAAALAAVLRAWRLEWSERCEEATANGDH